MATATQPASTRFLWSQPETCGPMQHAKGDPKDTLPVPFHELENTIHTSLKVHESTPTPTPKRFSVSVLNGSNGKKIDVEVNSSDTIGKLQEKVLKISPDLGAVPKLSPHILAVLKLSPHLREKLSPDLGASLNLVYNGKPLQPCQTLSELEVKPGVTLITYQKCIGG